MTKSNDRTHVILFSAAEAQSSQHPQYSDLLDGISLQLQDTRLLALIMQDNEINWPASRFLTWVSCRSTGRTGDTVRTYSEALKSYLSYTLSRAIDLQFVSEQTIQSYQNWLTDINQNRIGLSPSTINLRTTVARLFHSWCERQGILSSTIRHVYESNTRTPTFSKSFGRGYLSRNERKSSKIRYVERLPKILSREDISRLLSKSTAPFGLMVKWAVTTGMRRFEICDLKISDLPSRQDDKQGRLREMKIYRKGGSKITIFVPNALVEETWASIAFQRGTTTSASSVFLSDKGRAISRGTLSRQFKKDISEICEDTTFHHLRHTYAVVALTMLQQRATAGESINPLKTLQVLMGHRSIETTEIYLRALDIHSEAVEQTLYYLYGGEIDQ